MIKKEEIRDWVIYKITSPTGRVYVGRTCGFRKRMYEYSRNNSKEQKHIYRSILKYGFETHKCEIIEEFTGTLELANSREVFWIETNMCNICKYPEKRGMNLTDGGGGMVGYKTSDETKRKLSEYFKKNPTYNNLGKKASAETRLKLSLSQKGRKVWNTGLKMTKEYCDKMKGRKASEETKRKQSLAKKGKPSPHIGKKMKTPVWNKGLKGKQIGWNKGKKFQGSEQERKEKFGKHNIGNSYNKGRKHTSEMVEKMKAKLKGRPCPKKYKAVLQYDLLGNFIKEHSSIQGAAKFTGLHKSTVTGILRGRYKNPQKFTFKYKTRFNIISLQRRVFQLKDINSVINKVA